MKIIMIEATAEDLRASKTVADAFSDAINSLLAAFATCKKDEQESEDTE